MAHIKEFDEKGIIFAVAEALLSSHYSDDIERYLIFIRTYCLQNNIRWTIAKRVCIDWRWASINAINRVFNKDNKVHTLDQYINICYEITSDANKKCNVVALQICNYHLILKNSKK